MTLRTQAYHAFTRQLIDRRLAPGQFVTQRELAALTGFPLGAIREMIPRLEAEGLIRTIPQRGLQVAQLDVRELRQAFELREIIELAALSSFVDTASEATIETQRALLQSVLCEASEGITPALLARAQAVDWGFHDTLVDAMGNRFVSDIHRVNAIRIRMMMPERVTMSETTLPPSMAEHDAILTAIARRNHQLAAAALRSHLASARRRVLGIDIEAAIPARRASPGGVKHRHQRATALREERHA